jgi:negative regulator of flagellin synthesis FlgM
MATHPITGKPSVVYSSPKANKDTAAGNTTNSGTITDKIDANEIAQSLKKALQTASLTPVIDNDKVAAVKTALQNGNYEIDADRIAEKMLQFDRPFDST